MTAILSFLVGDLILYAIAAAVVALVLISVLGRAVPLWAWVIVVAAMSVSIFAERDVANQERMAHEKTKTSHALVLADVAAKAAEVHRRVNAAREQWSREFAALDLRHHQELTHAQSENTRLRTAARAGSVVVRIPGANCPVPAGDLPQATSTGGVVAQAAEIDAELRERVFDHRQALIDAEAQISYLIDYASKCAALEIAE